ncbi:MAG: hypothetical protein HQ567_28135 [Candidatus Nealsonbacteria bacterium]|nr:hypothetical protein [Candidatus Nealsonbacteria bacterium]
MRKIRQNNDHSMIAIPLTQGHPSRFLGKCIDELLLIGEMGPLAERLFKQNGIGVVMNIPLETRGQIVQSYLNGELTSTVGGCPHDE